MVQYKRMKLPLVLLRQVQRQTVILKSNTADQHARSTKTSLVSVLSGKDHDKLETMFTPKDNFIRFDGLIIMTTQVTVIAYLTKYVVL